MGGMSAEDLFSQLFGNAFGGGGGHGRQRSSGPRRGKDMVYPLKVALEDLYNGKTSKLSLQKNVICAKCNGKGGKDGSVKSCTTCHGRGVRVVLRQMGPMVQQMQMQCDDCDGRGEIIDPKDRCKDCHGKKVVTEKKVLEVFVEKGMQDGEKITFSGESDQAPNVIPGDVVIVLQQTPHPHFKRSGKDLYHEAKIDLLTALAGGEFHVKQLDGRSLKVQIKPGHVVKPGSVKIVQNEGMPEIKRPFDKGNLYIKFDLIFPDSNWTTSEKTAELANILPPRRTIKHNELGKVVDVVEVMDAPDSDNRAYRGAKNTHGHGHRHGHNDSDGDYMEEEEPGNGGGGPNVQCAQQ